MNKQEKIKQLQNELKAIEGIKDNILKEKREHIDRIQFLLDYQNRLEKIELDVSREISILGNETYLIIDEEDIEGFNFMNITLTNNISPLIALFIEKVLK